jgi:hypothetical protein
VGDLMKVLFIGREEVDLYETLMNSETSRIILRFYGPRRHACGVCVVVSSLGIALSLVSELRWYVRRYMADVLFELEEGIYGTYALAKEVYERDIRLDGAGILRSVYRLRDGTVERIPISSADSSRTPPETPPIKEEVWEVWSLENETAEIPLDEDLPGDGDENHLREGL